MSYTKRHFEKSIQEMIEDFTDADYQYQLWKEKQIAYYSELSENEELWDELNDVLDDGR